MSWREQLQPASFRGVPFHVLGDTASFGRRTVPHEYPFRDKPFVEDLGRRARTMRIDAVIVGADYMAGRDALIEAIERAGPGKLVHPQYGELQVSVIDDGLSIQHSSQEGGCCRITFACMESGAATFPNASTATTAVVEQRATAANATLGQGFLDRFSVSLLQSFGVDDAVARAGRWLDAIDGKVSVAPGVVIDGLSVLAGDLTGARTSLNALLGSPSDFVATARALVGAIVGALDVRQAVGVLVDLVGFGNGETVITTNTATRQAMATNRAAFLEYVHGLAATQAATALTQVEFTDYSDAIALRDQVLQAVDAVADTTRDDALYQTLTSLRAAVVRDVADRGADLDRLIIITPPATLPALVLAYQVYGDAGYDLELVSRNAASILRPGFVPGGVPLEVAVDA
ncbi:DNA circularization protein [Pseudoxanthomonas winnipegensis]|uniref:DNA circularization protein n=1 Tax=Pseudoxanthomonas winnipegensis TaxID=2480810 RepID=UPI001039C4A0|nr:DNA circularization N-terminal domain-containing protein [Pseudoxanthomonas winnipegensis]TBV76882.1 hypothetical protein EYC45_01570 [Pseudoxanthomonas winnipegensis]